MKKNMIKGSIAVLGLTAVLTTGGLIAYLPTQMHRPIHLR